jgi:hypothetical protein
MEVVNIVARQARVKISAPVSSTGRRPIRSESGPSSSHAAGHIQADRGRSQRHVGVEIAHHVDDPRLDKVGGQIGGKIIENQRAGKTSVAE